MFPAPRCLGRISIPAITVAEFVIEEPSCYPIRTFAWYFWSREIPIPSGMRILALGNASHSLFLIAFFDVAPVVGWPSLAIVFKVAVF